MMQEKHINIFFGGLFRDAEIFLAANKQRICKAVKLLDLFKIKGSDAFGWKTQIKWHLQGNKRALKIAFRNCKEFFVKKKKDGGYIMLVKA